MSRSHHSEEGGLAGVVAAAVRRLRRATRRLLDMVMSSRVRFPSLPVSESHGDAGSGPASAPVRPGLPGVNVYGFLSANLGLGEAARLYAGALARGGIAVSAFDVRIDVPHPRVESRWQDIGLPERPEHPINVVFVNPDYFLQAKPQLAAAANGDRLYTIAFWFWELSTLPAPWLDCLGEVDEIWVASSFVAAAVSARTDKPVVLIPTPIHVPDAPQRALRADFGLAEDAFVFLFSFDFHSFVQRKNPHALVDAFIAAFPRGDEKVQLVIKSNNGRHYRSQLRALLAHAGRDARILVRDQQLSRAQMVMLQGCADAYVSLHRSEGFGLGLAEAMALGKPAAATDWSGNTDFMNPANSRPIACERVPVPAGDYPHSEGTVWAEPSIADAAEAMRALASDPAYAARLGAEGRKTIVSTMNEARAVGAMADRLEIIGRSLCKEC